MDGAIPDLTDIELEISVASSASVEQLQALERVWLQRCPIYLSIVKANGVNVTVTGS